MADASNGKSGKLKAPNGASAAVAAPPMKVSEALGEIVWLMSQSPLHKQFFISDLEWMVMPPVLLGQFRLYHKPIEQPAATAPAAIPAPGARQPIGVVLWATVSEEVEARLKSDAPPKMRPQDWRSGDLAWVIEVIAPFGGHEAMVQDLKEKAYASQLLKYKKHAGAGNAAVVEL